MNSPYSIRRLLSCDVPRGAPRDAMLPEGSAGWAEPSERRELPDLLVHELDDHVEGAIRGGRPGLAHDEALAFTFEQLEVDDATGLPVRGDEAVEMRPRMRQVLRPLQIQHGRELNRLAALERVGRGALGHRLLRLPVEVVAGQHLVDTAWK